MHINRCLLMIKIGKTLSMLSYSGLGVAGACPAVVNSACVIVAVHPVAAASKQLSFRRTLCRILCAVHLVVAPGAERHQVRHVVFRHVANIIHCIGVLLRQQVVYFLR